MKKIQPQRLETYCCNTDGFIAHPCSEIQAMYKIDIAQLTSINEYVLINAAKPRNTSA